MTIAHSELLIELGLSKNEAKIYETLLRCGEATAGKIATIANLHRRNVYDATKRLVQKGLAFEVLQGNETTYRPVDPHKLSELLEEKTRALSEALPHLKKLYTDLPHDEDVYIYKGPEGWKNYLRELVEVGDDVYAIGAKGAWVDVPRNQFKQTLAEAKRKRVKMHLLFEHEATILQDEILEAYGNNYRFLPPGYSTPAVIVTFGDRVVIFSTPLGKIDEDTTFTVIRNQNIANAFHIWFKLLWNYASKQKKQPLRKKSR